MTDVLAERARKVGRLTLHSIGEISRLQRSLDNDAPYVTPQDMLAELREDNGELAKHMRGAHEMIEAENDVATSSILETYIDETERRAWFLYEARSCIATRRVGRGAPRPIGLRSPATCRRRRR